MSKASEKVERLLKECFPNHKVRKEKYVVYSHTSLKFDFFIPELRILIEVQGEQHFKFNKFFHSTKESFQGQKYRDSLKTQWAAGEGLKLITLTEKEIDLLDSSSFTKLIVENI